MVSSPTCREQYDPHRHADQLGIKIVYRPLKAGNGLWVPDLNAIFLKPRMRRVHELSVLAHEIAHAELGHTADSAKNEKTADVLAARRLIDAENLLELSRWTQELPELANELGVTERLVMAFLRSA